MKSVLVLCLFAATAWGYPNGAPTKICDTLTPTHSKGAIPPKNSASPYAITSQVPRVAQGNSLKVIVSSPQEASYQGFMIQARSPDSGKPLGRFTVVPIEAQAINCGDGQENTVTHVNKTLKTSLEFEWQPPSDYVGAVVFQGTVLQDYSTFWSGIQSDRVEVVRRSVDTSGQSAGISTTRRPKTTTPTPTLRPQADVASTATRDALTEGCDSTKSCFGVPSGCLNTGNCDGVVACLVKPDVAEFEMRAKGSVYVAVGLSDDGLMGKDSVVECVRPESGSRPSLHMSWNANNGKSNERMDASMDDYGVSLLEGSYVDNVISCKFTRSVVTNINGIEFNLIRDKHYMLLASGSSLKPNGVGYHDVVKEATSEAHNLAQGGSFAGASKLLLRLHGAFMISAWIGAASVGILLARYFKQTWVGNQLCGKDQWFAWHRFFMVLTWMLTIAGFVLIFVELQAWSSENNPHAILGTITTGLAFIQPFMAAIRPAPTSSRRPIFNWAHWLVGNAAHILAIVTIFFATKLAKAELPSWLDWVLVSYVAFHVVMHLILSIAGCASEKNNSKRVNTFPMKDMNSTSRNPLQSDRSLDAPHSGLRKFLLGLYLVIIILLTAGIVVIVVLAPIGDSIKEIQKIIMPGSV